jgi:hypothetical protein
VQGDPKELVQEGKSDPKVRTFLLRGQSGEESK